MSNKSTGPSVRRKPAKPYEGFPMFAHPSGQWAKKIRRKLFYFGVWADPEAALARLNREWPYLTEGKTPPAVDVSDGCTLRALCNDFLRSKEEKLNAGDLSAHTFRDYYRTCELLIDHFGRDRRVDDLKPADFRTFRAKLAKRFNAKSLEGRINRCRIVFNYAYENQLIEKPVSYGQNFDRPSAKALRRSRNQAGPKLFDREEVLSLLEAADIQLRAMALLGLNCGFGNTDVASLPQKAVNLKTGWVTFPRPKTEIPRRIPLWEETVSALKAAFAVRPKSAEPAGKDLCFLTKYGRPWARVKQKDKTDKAEKKAGPDFVAINPLSAQFGKLLRRLGINSRRGLGFYTLRHCFETYAGEAKDQVATNAVMGHVDSSMASVYRETISDKRLRDVVECVRRWLFSPSPEEEGGAK